MNIETKYNIGHKFWVPRVHKTFVTTETLCHEGEDWHRDVYEMKAFAKQKIVKCIDIAIHENGKYRIQYGVAKCEDNKPDLLQWYPEANMTDHTEESALIFAESFLSDNPTKEYFGN
jgi:hypothetical protein